MNHEHKQPDAVEPTTGDDLLTVMQEQNDRSQLNSRQAELVKRFQAGEMNAEEYRQESDDLEQMHAVGTGYRAEQARDRINGAERSLGRKVISLFHRK